VEVDFGTVVIVVAAIAGVLACLSFVGSGRSYERIGRSGLSLDDSPALRDGPLPGTPEYDAEARAEVLQMLEAKSARLQARGEPALDVEAEAERLTAPQGAADEGLRDEVRSLVEAANERRARRGEPPLDVEPEVDRRLRELGGWQ
jgi:hypothetical protein